MSEELATPQVDIETADETAPAHAEPQPAVQTIEDVAEDEAAHDAEVLSPAAQDDEEAGQDADEEHQGGDDANQDDEDDDDQDEDDEDPLEAEGDIAADYLEELLDIADLDGDIDTYVEGGRAHVSIVTDADVLVGKDGQVLDALQELSRLAVMTETGHRSRLMLDIAGHRERRRKELQVLAHDAIAEVKTSHEAVRLAPMNPFERKIVHDAVAEAGLLSESEGVEPKRRVVVLPAQ